VLWKWFILTIAERFVGPPGTCIAGTKKKKEGSTMSNSEEYLPAKAGNREAYIHIAFSCKFFNLVFEVGVPVTILLFLLLGL